VATGHFLTNKGKQYLMQGKWETGSGTTINCALISGTQNTAALTAATVADLDFLSQVFANGSVEPTTGTLTNYARKTLSRVNATETDATDSSDLDASDIVWTALGGALNLTLIGLAFFDNAGGTDASKILLSIDWFASSITTNGGDLTYAITTALYRAA
jgi:hypothetical protein